MSLIKFKEAVKGSRGIITIIAKNLGNSRKAIYDFMEKHPKMKELVEEEAEMPVDKAESVLHAKLNEGDMDAVKLILLNHKRGRKRGYGVKHEVEHSGEIDTKYDVEVFVTHERINDEAKNDDSLPKD